MSNDLPVPVTVEQMYLAAILVELRALHVLLTSTQTARKQQVDLSGVPVTLEERLELNERSLNTEYPRKRKPR